MQLNSVNGQQNANKVQLKKAEKQQTETKLQQQTNKSDSTETQTLQQLLARLNDEVATAETEQSDKKGSKPSGPPPEIQAELDKYGLTSTGSKEGDEAAIAQAKQTAQQKSQQKSQHKSV